VIILDEMDAIARKRGSISGDSTGVRDSVVNQLLAKMDGVKEASNVLVVGLTNRPELLDPALLRPGRLEVQLRVELPDLSGRRDILRIHTRRMREAGGMSSTACVFVEDLNEEGLPARTEHFTGAELAGLVRSAASFALARTVEDDKGDEDVGVLTIADLELALSEVRPALGKQDEVLEMRYPHGISPFSPSMERIMRDLERFTSTPEVSSTVRVKPRLQSMLVVGAGGNGGAGATALACWAAVDASNRGEADYVRLVTSLDLLSAGGGREEARAAALVERFSEAGEMQNSLLVLDDVDQLCAGSGPGGYSSIMLATLRALLRSPPASSNTAKAGGHSQAKKAKDGRKRGKTLRILAATSRSDAACVTLHELFDETLVVPLLSDAKSVRKLLAEGTEQSGLSVFDVNPMADMIVARLGSVGCKTALRLMERAVAMAGRGNAEEDVGKAQITSLEHILDDLTSDEATMNRLCEVID
jgi:vesicle-fusing ATPase